MAREQIEAAPVLLGSQGRTTSTSCRSWPGLTPVDPLEIDPLTGLGSAVSANGSRRSAINYQFDGAANNAQNRVTGAQAGTFAPVPEAIETFRAITHTYSASEGRNAGAIIQAVSRSGDGNWHGQARGFFRPHHNPIRSFDGADDSLGGWVGGGQLGGPLWEKRKLFFFVDGEGWHAAATDTDLAHLSDAVRRGDLSSLVPRPADPTTNAPSQRHRARPSARSVDAALPDAFLPAANIGDNSTANARTSIRAARPPWGGSIGVRARGRSTSAICSIAMTRCAPWASTWSRRPPALSRTESSSPTTRKRPRPLRPASFQQTTRLAGQRLSIASWQGRPDFRDVTANQFGFDFASFGADPGTIPDVTLYDDAGFERLRIAPFLFSESSAQTNWQISHDVLFRHGGTVLRSGALYRQGGWPFRNTENFAGSFSFPRPRSRRSAPRPTACAISCWAPGEYRLQTPRDLNLQWRELALYGEAELRPVSALQITLGLRFESQPPAVDTQDRIAAYRPGTQSQRFPETLPNLIFPGDRDGELGPLPRSTVENQGRNWGPRLGAAYSPSADSRWARWLLGDAGRSVLRGSYGVFYDFGAFAGSSAAALFQATYPPFSADNRFLNLSAAQNVFQRPLGATGANPSQIPPPLVRYPVLVFDRDFQNARAEQWNLGVQRLLPGDVFISAVYVGTRSSRLPRPTELNTFVRSPLRPFAFVRSMRLFSRYTDVRQFESSGRSRYNAMQLRAHRYLRNGLAFDVGYVWSRSDDDGSSVFGSSLSTEPWSVSSFDRRHNLTAAWVYQIRPPRRWSDRCSGWIAGMSQVCGAGAPACRWTYGRTTRPSLPERRTPRHRRSVPP